MSNPNFIILNGFAGAGKTTVAKRYLADHPLALVIEGDELIVNIGHWLENEPQARNMVYEMTKSLAAAHLAQGYDVVLPYLVADASHIAAFEQIAAEHQARFFNFMLFNEKETAIARLLKRGTWGEAGTDPLSEKDAPEIERLYTVMEAQLETQKNVIVIPQTGYSPEETYAVVLENITKATTNN